MTEELNQQLNDMLTEALQLKEQVSLHTPFSFSYSRPIDSLTIRPSTIKMLFLSSSMSMESRNKCSLILIKR